jgi:hypothetical protein
VATPSANFVFFGSGLLIGVDLAEADDTAVAGTSGIAPPELSDIATGSTGFGLECLADLAGVAIGDGFREPKLV